MRGSLQRALVAVALSLPLSAASAWTPETRVRMVDEAVRLMPASVRLALERHRQALLSGMLTPMLEEDGPEHLPPWSGGELDTRVAASAGRLATLLEQPGPFAAVAEGFGELAHFVADASFPPQAGESDGAQRHAHFSAFCESRREKFPFVFYGHDDARLAHGDFRGFALELARAAGRDDVRLAAAYARAGSPPDPTHFDDRSVPFAVGSLSYSRGITSIVRAWLAVWSAAEGDMGSTPYWKLPDPEPPAGNP